MVGTSLIIMKGSEGSLQEFIFFLVDLLRVDNLELKNEFHLRIHYVRKPVNLPT